jgi:hypothetical protein
MEEVEKTIVEGFVIEKIISYKVAGHRFETYEECVDFALRIKLEKFYNSDPIPMEVGTIDFDTFWDWATVNKVLLRKIVDTIYPVDTAVPNQFYQ